MKALVRTFNEKIAGGTGFPLRPSKYRPFKYWKLFEKHLLIALDELGFQTDIIPENPLKTNDYPNYSIKISVHKNKKILPNYDFFYMQMHLPNLFVFNNNGWGADSSVKISDNDLNYLDQKKIEKFIYKLKERFLKNNTTKHEYKKILNYFNFKGSPINYVFCPLQTPRDYVIKNHSKISVLNYIEICSKWAYRNNFDIVFKRHPFSLNDKLINASLMYHCLKYSNVYVLHENIHDMINKSCGVMLINSGVGFEALIHGKTVLTLGNCDYNISTLRSKKRDLSDIYPCDFYNTNFKKSHSLIYHYCNQYGYYFNDDSIDTSIIQRIKNYIKTEIY